MQATGYRRVSRERREVEGMGDQLQARAIADYCAYRGWQVDQLAADLNTSGGIPLAERENGRELLRRCEAGCRIVIVYKLDRLGRNVADIAKQIEWFHAKGIQLVSVSEGFDLGTSMGRAMAHLLAVFAEFERSMGSDRMKSLHKTLRDMGRKQGPRVRYGWNESEGKQLVVCEREQAVIRRMRNLRSRGWKDSTIAKLLNQDGVPAKMGGRWSAVTVKGVLAQPPLKRSAVDDAQGEQKDGEA